MKLFALFLTVLTVATSTVFSQVQCAVDVVIQEGTAITMCEDAPQTLNATGGFVSYDWTGPETLTGQTITPSFSGQYVVAATDGVGCISNDTIQVTINPSPVDAIVSSEGNPLCAGSAGTNLSLSGTYNAYDWGGGISTPTFFASSAGTYTVTFTDNNGCVGQSSFDLEVVQFDLVPSSNSFCAGGSVILTASGATNYAWSTGETTNSIVVDPDATTVYTVTMTNGSCSATLSETVTPVEVEPFEFPDTLYMAVGTSVYINGPDEYTSYNWSPAQNLSNPTMQGVYFSGDSSTVVTLNAEHQDGCTWTGQVVVIVVRATIPNGFSPNGDGKNDFFVIPELYEYPGNLTVFNRWGDVVYSNPNYQNQWGGTCEADLCIGGDLLPEGTYFYLLDIQGITFKGYITLKL